MHRLSSSCRASDGGCSHHGGIGEFFVARALAHAIAPAPALAPARRGLAEAAWLLPSVRVSSRASAIDSESERGEGGLDPERGDMRWGAEGRSVSILASSHCCSVLCRASVCAKYSFRCSRDTGVYLTPFGFKCVFRLLSLV